MCRRTPRLGDPYTAGLAGLAQRSTQQNKISLMGRKGRKGEERERGVDREKELVPLCKQVQAGRDGLWE